MGSRMPRSKGRQMQPSLDKQSANHLVDMVGLIRNHPNGNHRKSTIWALLHLRVSVQVEAMSNGCRKFLLDSMSLAKVENLQAFYERYVESRVEDVKADGWCIIMMYGPTGAGKSYTMLRVANKKGVTHYAMLQLVTHWTLETNGGDFGDGGIEVQAMVWEIYNEETYDLLASVCAPKFGFGTLFKLSKSSVRRVSKFEPECLLPA